MKKLKQNLFEGAKATDPKLSNSKKSTDNTDNSDSA